MDLPKALNEFSNKLKEIYEQLNQQLIESQVIKPLEMQVEYRTFYTENDDILADAYLEAARRYLERLGKAAEYHYEKEAHTMFGLSRIFIRFIPHDRKHSFLKPIYSFYTPIIGIEERHSDLLYASLTLWYKEQNTGITNACEHFNFVINVEEQVNDFRTMAGPFFFEEFWQNPNVINNLRPGYEEDGLRKMIESLQPVRMEIH